jgi:hypothetical protein
MLTVVAVPEPEDPLRRLRLRYPGTCRACGIALSRGSWAWYDDRERQVVCLACGPCEPTCTDDAAGASARIEGERRVNFRTEKVRRQHGDYAAEVARRLASSDISASWGKGASGEARLAAFIDREVGDQVLCLHDRLVPGSQANIDHIWIAPTGVWVVDSKTHAGKLERRDTGPLWRQENQVFVNGRNRTSLANGVTRQVEAVLAALRPDPTLAVVEVHGVLCFLEADWGLLDFPFQVGNVWVMYAGALRKRLKKSGKVDRERMERIAHRLDLSLPHAV